MPRLTTEPIPTISNLVSVAPASQDARPIAPRLPWLKRAVDIVLAAIGLLLAGPLILLGAACVALEDRGSPWFTQPRLGLGGGTFRIFKLRTMRRHDLPFRETGQVTEAHPLVLRSGRWLRRLKIDELPQLLNILRGDMSVVGPRPPLVDDLAGYDDYQRRRLEMRPGLTGWAQIHGSVTLDWSNRILMDVWYIDHWSLWLDLKILLLTPWAVIRGEQVNNSVLEQARRHREQADQTA